MAPPPPDHLESDQKLSVICNLDTFPCLIHATVLLLFTFLRFEILLKHFVIRQSVIT